MGAEQPRGVTRFLHDILHHITSGVGRENELQTLRDEWEGKFDALDGRIPDGLFILPLKVKDIEDLHPAIKEIFFEGSYENPQLWGQILSKSEESGLHRILDFTVRDGEDVKGFITPSQGIDGAVRIAIHKGSTIAPMHHFLLPRQDTDSEEFTMGVAVSLLDFVDARIPGLAQAQGE